MASLWPPRARHASTSLTATRPPQVWKNAFYEGSARVPLIVSGGAVAGAGLPRGRVVTNLTSLLDVYPTLMTWVGRSDPSHPAPGVDLSGASLAPFLGAGPAGGGGAGQSPRPDYVVSQYHSNMGNTGGFSVVQGRYKYNAFGHGFNSTFGGYAPQLFDLDADPDEMNDLARERAAAVWPPCGRLVVTHFQSPCSRRVPAVLPPCEPPCKPLVATGSQPAVVARLDALLRRELSRGSNLISRDGDYHAIDRFVKTQQQQLYSDFFLNAGQLERRWQARNVSAPGRHVTLPQPRTQRRRKSKPKPRPCPASAAGTSRLRGAQAELRRLPAGRRRAGGAMRSQHGSSRVATARRRGRGAVQAEAALPQGVHWLRRGRLGKGAGVDARPSLTLLEARGPSPCSRGCVRWAVSRPGRRVARKEDGFAAVPGSSKQRNSVARVRPTTCAYAYSFDCLRIRDGFVCL